jgi:hypothetical protein
MSIRNLRRGTCNMRRARTHRPGVRDRAALERDGAIAHANHAAAAAVVLRTAGAATPIAIGRRTPSADTRSPLRTRPDPHAPLLRCRLSPRCRTARCPCACRAHRRHRDSQTAHERIATPNNMCAIEDAIRDVHRCNKNCAPMQRATSTDATCNRCRCNMQPVPLQHATRTSATRWLMHHATCAGASLECP